MKILKLICIIILSLNLSAKAVIKNVPAQYSTIQSGILACSNGDTLLVQPGTYFENINFRGRKIVLTSMFYLNHNYSFIQSTIINGSTPVSPDSASCVIFNNHEDSTTVLQGFTLTGGSGTKWTDEYGAGLYREGGGILSALSSPVIQYNIVTGNFCIPGGGAVSTGGGGMRIGDGYPRVYNNIVINNSARYGGGIVLNYTGGEYKNNLVCKNYGSVEFGAGTAMWLNGVFSRPKTIENNTIVFNTALSSIPGILGNGATATLRNNIVWGNSSPTSTLQVNGSGMTVRYCDVQGGYTGAGNTNVDPLFDSTNYYLKTGSPCIDIGDSSTIYNDPPDPGNPILANWPSRGLIRNDMGAYGGSRSSIISNTVVGITGSFENILPEKFSLKQNYPNPFNPVTNLEFSIPEFGFVSLKVYDMLGKEVEALVNADLNPGTYKYNFDASALTSGIYFFTLKVSSPLSSGEFNETKKMLLIK